MSEVKMSNSVKVGDQFKLPVHVGDRGTIVQSNGERIDYLKLDLMVSCIAINSHDRLQQEIAELKSALKSMIGKGIDLLNVEDVSDEEDAFSIHSKFNDVIIDSERLLVKLNKSN
ncbi:coil containing protein [Vibrio phage 1.111.B._10N.286.45.E6]|nr:coil containing protein [Vibrio phage 1.111.A._10N.286.45.E6]AUR88303.1 coil containing protein [Vibrio phage 1.111.B._10N.286.45.E6]